MKIRSRHAGTCTCSANIMGKQRGKASVSKPDQWESILSVGRSVAQSTRRNHQAREFVLVAQPENNRNDRCIARISWYRSPRTVSPYRFRHAVFFRRPASGDFDLLGPRDCALDLCIGEKPKQTRGRSRANKLRIAFFIGICIFIRIFAYWTYLSIYFAYVYNIIVILDCCKNRGFLFWEKQICLPCWWKKIVFYFNFWNMYHNIYVFLSISIRRTRKNVLSFVFRDILKKTRSYPSKILNTFEKCILMTSSGSTFPTRIEINYLTHYLKRLSIL